MPGVIRTRVGYTGGTTPQPTYRNMGDHTETLQIDYDPTQIDYETILRKFWNGHNPSRPVWKRQYMSAVFYHNEQQKEIALATMAEHAAKTRRDIHTEIAPAGQFYLAEDYHQKFRLQTDKTLFAEFQKIYPSFSDFVDSTAVARVNGLVAGHRAAESLTEYGLSEQAQAQLKKWR